MVDQTTVLGRLLDALLSEDDDSVSVRKLLDENPSLDINAIHYHSLALHSGTNNLFRVGDTNITPLHLARWADNEKTVYLLLERNAKQMSTNDSFVTPLHCTLQQFRPRGKGFYILKVLLGQFQTSQKLKDYLNQGDYLGRTVLHLAIQDSDFETVRILVEDYGADVSKTTNSGQTCFHIAATAEYSTTIDYLFSRPEFNREFYQKLDGNGNTAWDVANGSAEPNDLYGGFRWRIVKAFMKKELLTRKVEIREIGGFLVRTVKPQQSGRIFVEKIKIDLCLDWPNNRSVSLALLLQQEAPNEILEQFSNGLLDDHVHGGPVDDSNTLIRYREPSCIFDLGTECISLVMPFFHLQTRTELEYWRDDTKRELSFSHFSHEWTCCLGKRSKSYGICLPLTLDEYCCPILQWEILSQRNNDQVYAKTILEENRTNDNAKTAKRLEKSPKVTNQPKDNSKMIVISQLWLWSFGTSLVVSPACDPTFTDAEPPLEKYRGKGTPVEGRTGKMLRTVDPKLRVGRIISHLLEYLDDPNKSRPTLDPSSRQPQTSQPSDESPLNKFQKAITLVSDNVNQYLRDISMEKTSSDQEKNYINEIGDIREEISMIKRVLTQQEDVWKDFALTAFPNSWPYGPDGRMTVPKEVLERAGSVELKEWRIIVKIPAKISKYHRRLEALDEEAARVEQAIGVKLDLMAKHASIRESHRTAIMSAAVFGFTLITIVFTPLSFFATLFALPIDSFQGSQSLGRFSNETGMYTTTYIGKWIATGELVSIAVTLFAMWLAVRYGMGVHVFTDFWTSLHEKARLVIEPMDRQLGEKEKSKSASTATRRGIQASKPDRKETDLEAQ